MKMIEIDKPLSPEKIKDAIEKKSKEGNKKSLRKHFGQLKRGLDGMTYQKKIRNDWEYKT